MWINRLSLVLLFLTNVIALTQDSTEDFDTGRPCGFRIAPCPTGFTCSRTDPTCTRGENCAGICKPRTSSKQTPPDRQYTDCGGHRRNAPICKADELCVHDPWGIECCDAPGLCVKPVFCGGKEGKKCGGNLICVDDARDNCDPKEGGVGCAGLCV